MDQVRPTEEQVARPVGRDIRTACTAGLHRMASAIGTDCSIAAVVTAIRTNRKP